jgi:hypothetical protein
VGFFIPKEARDETNGWSDQPSRKNDWNQIVASGRKGRCARSWQWQYYVELVVDVAFLFQEGHSLAVH